MLDLKISKGLEGIIVGETKLSYVDGKNGKLIYCGYNIEKLVGCSYEEICYLFLYGKLPNTKELNSIVYQLQLERKLPSLIIDFICKMSNNVHPMSILRSAFSMLSIIKYDFNDKSDDNIRNIGLSLISKITSISAIIMRVKNGLDPIKPNLKLGHVANFLYMFTGKIVDDMMINTLNTAFVLHADHSFNASTFTSRVVASSLSDLISSITAAIGSLKGELHGGANTAVMKSLLEINNIENVEAWLSKILVQKKKVMGFGHRVYKVIDPRAKPLKIMSRKWGLRTNSIKWFLISEKLECLMKEKKGLNANVDFYSASTYYSMGIKPEMFTVIFATSRIIGWISHYIEQITNNRIIRPKSNYTGVINKEFIPKKNTK